MAIQVRRGLKKDFDPNKMLPGEWAVSIDSNTSNQIVWMCFAAGVCKRMGTYEDFAAQIAGATDDIRVQYVDEFNAILADIQALADTVSTDKDIVVVAKSDIVDTYIPQIQSYVNSAQESSSNATAKAEEALGYSVISKSYAVGGTGTRENEETDNAEYYYQQAKSTAESLGSPINPQGTIAFEDLPTLSEVGTNWMYNISNEFTTTEDFVEGAGNVMPLGTNVYKTASGKWDCFAGSPVTGIKGNKETTYRKGNVNITPANIGAIADGGDTANNIVTFTSGDSTSTTAWTDVEALVTGEKHSSLLNKISTMIKNVRWLYKMLGNTDISEISDGTVTGILAFLKSSIDTTNSNLSGTGWITLDSTYNISYCVKSGIVYVRCQYNLDKGTEYRTTNTIPEEYRPKFSKPDPCGIVEDYYGHANAYISVKSNGVVVIKNNGDYVYNGVLGSISYPI